ncbi:hypothetical protein KY290_030426 [Solanum tuberosum]|uniref:Uncharacterized protein n=1 Tax=Solanum tuberosum TaxID=4113 RepID=A0ABQ7UQ80_SOLTU|nr:hypothetical protein KY284_028815 [Solanum tuberosum]KAH0667599.1 hypothetical protein KY285_028805 [Solanum tuberosum]KAH0751194.1 hypothetical protein KY290_030426 [Solanum tuberosum]
MNKQKVSILSYFKQLEVEVGKLKRKIEELELMKKQQETKAIETSRKAIPSMEKGKKQLMIANSDFMAKMEEKFLNLVSKLEEKDKAITRFTREIREMEVMKFEGSPQVNLISLKWMMKSF